MVHRRKSGRKYLVFDSMELHSADENEEVLKKYNEIWDEIKNQIETINTGKTSEDFMKIKFG